MSAADLRSKITSATVPGTLLFTIAVTDVDPVKAQTYANIVIDELVETVNELESRGTDKAVAGVLVVNAPSYPTTAKGWASTSASSSARWPACWSACWVRS